MRPTTLPVLAIASLSLMLGACDEAEPQPISTRQPAESPPPMINPADPGSGIQPSPEAAAPDDGRISVAGLVWDVPESWTASAATSPMRAAEIDPAGAGEVVVYFFGEGQGGDVQMNIDRWSRQVIDDADEPVEPRVERTETESGLPLTLVASEGTYLAGMPGQPRTEQPESGFRAAIVEGPSGNVFIKWTGPAEAVETQEEAWNVFVRSIRAE